MELFKFLIDFILHIDRHLIELVQAYGNWVYGILFLIIFCETGAGGHAAALPGDSFAVCCRCAGRAGAMQVHGLA